MHSFTRNHRASGEELASKTQGIVTISAWLYDLMVKRFVMHGREREFRRMVADLAQIQPGEAVLDVGCGTGTLALEAYVHVGKTGRVCGIDPSVQLLAGARRKAVRAGFPINFQQGGIEQIAFPDQSFDVVLSTFTIHHVPHDLKRQGLAEIARVLKAGGRLLVVDFKRAEEHQGQIEQEHHGEMGLQDLPILMEEVGFCQMEIGEIPFHIRSFDAGHQLYGFVKARKGVGLLV